MPSETSKKVAFLVAAEGIERVELTEPWKAVTASGHQAVLVSPKAGEVQTLDRVEDFDLLVLPGGVANPDALRLDTGAVQLVRDFMAAGRPVAAICHAPWMLVEAGVVQGRRLTSWPSLQTDVRNAGGEWVDEALVVDGNLVTSRKPHDLPQFCGAIVEALEHGAAANPA
jgi:protease I